MSQFQQIEFMAEKKIRVDSLFVEVLLQSGTELAYLCS